jgi:hypothetical protein
MCRLAKASEKVTFEVLVGVVGVRYRFRQDELFERITIIKRSPQNK